MSSVAQRLTITEGAVIQGGSSTVEAKLTDGSGSPMPGISVAATGPTGLTFTTAATDAKGVARLTVNASGSITSGAKTVTFAAGSVDAKGVVRVLGKVADVIADDLELTQGSAASILVKVVDANGVRIPGRVLTFGSGDLVVSTQATTDSSGVARVAVTAPLTAAAGSRSIAVSDAGVVVGGVNVEVITGVASVTSYGTLAKGFEGTLRVQLRDASGVVVAGRNVSVVSTSGNLVVTGSAVTGDDGVAEVPVRVAADAYPGTVTLTYDNGTRSIKFGVVIR